MMKAYRGAIIRRLAIKRQLRKAGLTIDSRELLDLHALRGLRRWWLQSGGQTPVQTYRLLNR